MLLRRSVSVFIATVFCLALTSGPSSADPYGSRNIIWEIISNCLNPNIKDYCSRCLWPIAPNNCTGDNSCLKTTEIWQKSSEYVVIRDRKMCGCPESFVHGLAIPLAKVTGVEDPERPAGIWKFAWNEAGKRIDDQAAIALVVNPPVSRSQDQLHVHIVRLRTDARLKLAKRKSVKFCCLEDAWRKASELASEEGLGKYGVLVALAPEKGFLVVVDKNSPEEMYTEERCH